MIVVLAVAFAAATPPQPAAATQGSQCQRSKVQPVQGTRREGVHKLNQEPPARQLYTVLRTEDGCTRPVFVNDRVIGGGR